MLRIYTMNQLTHIIERCKSYREIRVAERYFEEHERAYIQIERLIIQSFLDFQKNYIENFSP